MPQSWNNFYFMLGSAAAGLIGLLFVVVTLTAGLERSNAQRGQALYMSPTALNFAVVLVVSAAAIAPGPPAWLMAAIVALGGLIGLGNGVRSTLGIARAPVGNETPHWSDLWMYGIAPVVIYLALEVTAAGIGARASWAPNVMAVLLLGLLLVGIRNAWDLVTWIAPMKNRPQG